MIFQYTSSNKFLSDFVNKLPKRGFGEAKKIAAQLGVSSTYVSQVLADKKVLTLEQAMELTRYLGLSQLESDYFLLLIQCDRAGSIKLKNYFLEKLKNLQQKSLNLATRVEAKRALNDQEKSIFYSSSLYSSIHIYCATDKNGRSLEEVAQRFSIIRAKAAEIMRFLCDSNLCIEKNGHFFTGTQSTHLEQNSPHLLKHYTNWRLRAIQAAENLKPDELMYSVNVALSVKDFSELREETSDFIKKFLDKVHPSPSEEIACLNLDWFWIRN